jgi:hypothetical protein
VAQKMQTLNSGQLTIKAKELQQAKAHEIKEIGEEVNSSEKPGSEKAEKKDTHEVNSNIRSLLANTMSI